MREGSEIVQTFISTIEGFAEKVVLDYSAESKNY